MLKGCFVLVLNFFLKASLNSKDSFHKFFFLNHYVVVCYPLEDRCFGWMEPSLFYVKILLYLCLCHNSFGHFPILNELVVSNECLKKDLMSNIEWVSEFFLLIFCCCLTYPGFSHAVILSHIPTVWPDVQKSSASMLAF